MSGLFARSPVFFATHPIFSFLSHPPFFSEPAPGRHVALSHDGRKNRPRARFHPARADKSTDRKTRTNTAALHASVRAHPRTRVEPCASRDANANHGPDRRCRCARTASARAPGAWRACARGPAQRRAVRATGEGWVGWTRVVLADGVGCPDATHVHPRPRSTTGRWHAACPLTPAESARRSAQKRQPSRRRSSCAPPATHAGPREAAVRVGGGGGREGGGWGAGDPRALLAPPHSPVFASRPHSLRARARWR